MKKFTLLIALAFTGWHAQAQTVAPQVISSSGGSGQSPTAELSWTIGEAVIATETNTNNSLTQGFQQPNLLVTLLKEASDQNASWNVFPNPSTDQINIQYNFESGEPMNYKLFDNTGKLIFENKSAGKLTQVPVQTLAAGEYFLQVSNNKSQQIFKIQKQK